MIQDPADLVAAFNDGTLTILDRPHFMSEADLSLLHLANAGDESAAIRLHRSLCGDAWLWHLGYDNRAVLTKRDDPDTTISVISLNPAHALALAVLQAVFTQPLASG